ncbi:MAG TPA: hypothetical protein ENJ45_05510, partial [Phaeodactylibacter sp.]|nr:hypothetical protein [Phaeodactylibacter sp.]
MKKLIFFFFLIYFLPAISQGQNFSIKKNILWDENPIIHNPTGKHPLKIWSFEGAYYHGSTPSLPYMGEQFLVSSYGNIEVSIVNAVFEPFDKKVSPDDWVLKEDLVFETRVEQERNNFFAIIQFIPIIKIGDNQYQRLSHIELRIRFTPLPKPSLRDDNTYTSVLSDGDIYKIAIAEQGMHKISYSFLKDELGIDLDNIHPASIKLYGNGAGPLPEPIATERIDDLEENAIWIKGGEDGSFDPEDFILFYAEGLHKWSFDESKKVINQKTNIYDTQSYYFLKIDQNNNARRVGDSSHSQASLSSTTHSTNTYTELVRIEEDKYNLLYENSSTQGSGQNWYMDIYNPLRTRSYPVELNDIVSNEEAHIKVRFAGRTAFSSKYHISIGGITLISEPITATNLTNSESLYARVIYIDTTILLNASANFTINVNYPAVGDGTNTGWLDFIQLNLRRNLKLAGNDMVFRDVKSLNHSSTKYKISNASTDTKVWDISNPLRPKGILNTALSGSTLSFGAHSEEMHTYIAFNENADFPS